MPAHSPYEYRLADYHPGEDDPEEWARALTREGWQYAAADTGVPVVVNGHKVIRYYLRRHSGPPPTR